jgi:hypothetical protein
MLARPARTAHYHLQRNPEKLGNKEVALIMNGGGVSVAIMFLPGVGPLLFAWARSADPLVHREKIRTMLARAWKFIALGA